MSKFALQSRKVQKNGGPGILFFSSSSACFCFSAALADFFLPGIVDEMAEG